MTTPQPKVMISSTARDLPAHRQEVLDACLRQSMFPLMMEHLPASDAEAIAVSLGMVDEADIYLGIFAYRYDYVPQGHAISITEMEYNRAVERQIPRLIFVMHDNHPITAKDVEMGAGAAKLKTFKERVQLNRCPRWRSTRMMSLGRGGNPRRGTRSAADLTNDRRKKFHRRRSCARPVE